MTNYKNSGIEWIGDIPKNWKVNRLKIVLQERNENNNPIKTDYILSLTNDRGVIPYTDKGEIGNKSKDDISGYKLAYPNDIVLNSMNVIIGSVGISKYYGAVSPVYYMLKPRYDSDDVRFYNYIFQTNEFQNRLKGYGNGILEIRMRIQMLKLNTVELPIPPSEEQFKIANFLDRKCSQIDAFISLEEKEIEKLKEYKTAVITKAVTKGLNENVPMKESGIEWIGQVPKSWELKKLKFISNSFYKGNGITKEDIVDNGNTPCVRYGDIYTKYENCFNECLVRTNIEKISCPQYFEHGDVLFTATGELIEEIGKSVVYLGKEKCLAGGDVIVLKHNQNPEFFGYALDSHYARIQKGYGKAKLKVVHTSVFIIGNMYVALPSIEEQDRIAKYLNKKSKEISDLIEIKHRKIEELETYKRSMIYEYVTGKKRCI